MVNKYTKPNRCIVSASMVYLIKVYSRFIVIVFSFNAGGLNYRLIFYCRKILGSSHYCNTMVHYTDSYSLLVYYYGNRSE